MKFHKLFFIAFISTLFFTSCDPEEDSPPIYTSKGTYDSGVLVLYEGNSANSGISYISFDLNSVDGNIYGEANGSNLGAFAQSITFNNELAYVVVSGSQKIEIVNRYTMKKISTITTNIENPRYIVFSATKLYVSNQASFSTLNDDYIAVFNIENNAFIKNISVPGGAAEKMVINSNKLYLAQGGLYGNGNKIQVINTTTDLVEDAITVGDSPNSMEIIGTDLWVLCGGNSNYFPVASEASSGKLIKINTNTNAVLAVINFPLDTGGDFPTSIYPNNLTLNNSDKYFTIGNSIYKVKETPSTTGSQITYSYELLFATSAQNLLSLAIKTNNIYVSDVKDYSSNGDVLVYSLGGVVDGPALGILRKSINIGGIAPNGFYFNQ